MKFIPLRYCLRMIVNDLRAFFGHVFGDTQTVFVAGYPKSGMTWVENFISHIPGYNPRRLAGDREVLRLHGLPHDAFKRLPSFGYSSIKTHIHPGDENIAVLEQNGIDKVLVMYRDPRDIVVSHYYHVLNSNPWKEGDPWYANYTTMTKEEGIQHSMDLIIDDYSAWVGGWRKVPSSHPNMACAYVTYEDLRKDPERVFSRILHFFGIRLDDAAFHATIEAASRVRGTGNRRWLVSGAPGGTLHQTEGKGWWLARGTDC